MNWISIKAIIVLAFVLAGCKSTHSDVYSERNDVWEMKKFAYHAFIREIFSENSNQKKVLVIINQDREFGPEIRMVAKSHIGKKPTIKFIDADDVSSKEDYLEKLRNLNPDVLLGIPKLHFNGTNECFINTGCMFFFEKREKTESFSISIYMEKVQGKWVGKGRASRAYLD